MEASWLHLRMLHSEQNLYCTAINVCMHTATVLCWAPEKHAQK